MNSVSNNRHTAVAKPLLIAFLVLWLQVPMYYIRTLIQERDTSESQATNQVAQMAGGDQVISAPILTVLYTSAPDASGARTSGTAFLLPHNLKVLGKLSASTRSRGLFEIPVYTSVVTIEGDFLLSDLRSTIGESSVVDSQSTVSLGIRDLRGIRNVQQISWNEQKFEFIPSGAIPNQMEHGIESSVPMKNDQDRYTFSMQLELSGSRSFQVRPVAKSAHLTLTSNWKDPSFTGSLIPSERTVDDNGFNAEWHLSDLSLGIPIAWKFLPAHFDAASEKATAGVQLMSPVNSHRMSERATKYELLFFFLIFLAFFIYEVLGEVRIHPIQYLLVGAALTLFYLLLLSLSEHVGFGLAYVIATGLSTGLVSGYSRAILRRSSRTWIILPLMVGMYGFLYTLLIEEDYSLLSGSLGLALILGVVMYVTRNVDWFSFGSAPKPDRVVLNETAPQQPVA